MKYITIEEKELFETLINLSGIGPKTALSIIGHTDYDHFFLAISKADIKMLSKIPGFGKKSAERLIVEMKGKLKDLDSLLQKFYKQTQKDMLKDTEVLDDFINRDDVSLYDIMENLEMKADEGGQPISILEVLSAD